MNPALALADDSANCLVVPAVPSQWSRAERIAGDLRLPVAPSPDASTQPVLLVIDADRAWLQQNTDPRPGPVFVDFASAEMRHRRRGGQNELLGRAVGVRANRLPAVMDATAGLGRDAFVLADLGCEVTLVERSPVLAWMLGQAIAGARISAHAPAREAAERLHLRPGDSLDVEDACGADVLYLDPMFSTRKGTAAVKKDLSLLQALHAAEPANEEQLFNWALSQPVARVVIKRPLRAPSLGGRAPSHALSGKAIRFDVYVR